MARISRLDPALSGVRTGLIIFDALNGYLHSGSAEKDAFLAERNIIPNMQRLLEGARKVGMTTFYPSGAHADDGSDTVLRLTDTTMESWSPATHAIQRAATTTSSSWSACSRAWAA